MKDSTALIGLIGVLLGGGLNVLQGEYARLRERQAIKAVLTADIRCLLTLVETRRFIEGMQSYLSTLEEAVAAGFGDRLVSRWRIPLTGEYFSCYEAMLPRFSLLAPRQAVRFALFYTFAKSATEVMTTRGAADTPIRTDRCAKIVSTELNMMRRAMSLGERILDEASGDLGAHINYLLSSR